LPRVDMTINELFDRFMQAKPSRLAATTLQRYEKTPKAESPTALAAYRFFSKR
jgi:hypothetical protein